MHVYKSGNRMLPGSNMNFSGINPDQTLHLYRQPVPIQSLLSLSHPIQFRCRVLLISRRLPAQSLARRPILNQRILSRSLSRMPLSPPASTLEII
jgi:hypothetical protein